VRKAGDPVIVDISAVAGCAAVFNFQVFAIIGSEIPPDE